MSTYNGTFNYGIYLGQTPATLGVGGYVRNNLGGDAVYGSPFAAHPWNFTNLGTIRATASNGIGVALNAGASVGNGATSATGALITGPADGVSISGDLMPIFRAVSTILARPAFGLPLPIATESLTAMVLIERTRAWVKGIEPAYPWP